MRNLPEGIHAQFKAVRREQGLTQSELARRAGCRQSAISMFESGRHDALSRATLEAVAEVLGIEILPAPPGVGGGRIAKYCPVAACPSSVPYAVGDQLCFKPALVMEAADTRGHCAWCGELLESACPTPGCDAAIASGSFCPSCGEAYVAPAVAVGGSIEAWADRQRERMREVQSLSAATVREETADAVVVSLSQGREREARKAAGQAEP